MLLAELEVWHTRPAVPTRRVALGHMVLPVDPAPGFGGLLLGSIVAAHLPGINDELVPDIHRLIGQVERGERIVQPRLRHRFQVDRHGLAVSRHRLVGEDEDIAFERHTIGTDLAQVLGAIYAAERLAPEYRRQIGPLLQKAAHWRGPIGSGADRPPRRLADPHARGARRSPRCGRWASSVSSSGARRRPSVRSPPSSGSACVTSIPITAARASTRPRR